MKLFSRGPVDVACDGKVRCADIVIVVFLGWALRVPIGLRCEFGIEIDGGKK